MEGLCCTLVGIIIVVSLRLPLADDEENHSILNDTLATPAMDFILSVIGLTKIEESISSLIIRFEGVDSVDENRKGNRVGSSSSSNNYNLIEMVDIDFTDRILKTVFNAIKTFHMNNPKNDVFHRSSMSNGLTIVVTDGPASKANGKLAENEKNNRLTKSNARLNDSNSEGNKSFQDNLDHPQSNVKMTSDNESQMVHFFKKEEEVLRKENAELKQKVSDLENSQLESKLFFEKHLKVLELEKLQLETQVNELHNKLQDQEKKNKEMQKQAQINASLAEDYIKNLTNELKMLQDEMKHNGTLILDLEGILKQRDTEIKELKASLDITHASLPLPNQIVTDSNSSMNVANDSNKTMLLEKELQKTKADLNAILDEKKTWESTLKKGNDKIKVLEKDQEDMMNLIDELEKKLKTQKL